MAQQQVDKNASFDKAIKVFRRHGGVLRTSEAIRFGIHPRTLYAMRDAGALECLSRGLYRVADLPPLGSPDLVAAALKVPTGVICLISALAYNELTTQIPHEVYLLWSSPTGHPAKHIAQIRWASDRPASYAACVSCSTRCTPSRRSLQPPGLDTHSRSAIPVSGC